MESSDGWDTVQNDQSLHQLILKIERICVGFDDHKHEVYHLVQAMKTLFLYTQTDKESVEDYSRNLTSIWDTRPRPLVHIREEAVRVVAKMRITLNQDLKKGFATVYD